MNKICAWETITCKSYSLILQQILLEHIKFMMVFLSFWKYIMPNFTLVKLQKFVPFGDTQVVASMDLKDVLKTRRSQVPSTTLSVHRVFRMSHDRVVE